MTSSLNLTADSSPVWNQIKNDLISKQIIGLDNQTLQHIENIFSIHTKDFFDRLENCEMPSGLKTEIKKLTVIHSKLNHFREKMTGNQHCNDDTLSKLTEVLKDFLEGKNNYGGFQERMRLFNNQSMLHKRFEMNQPVHESVLTDALRYIKDHVEKININDYFSFKLDEEIDETNAKIVMENFLSIDNNFLNLKLFFDSIKDPSSLPQIYFNENENAHLNEITQQAASLANRLKQKYQNEFAAHNWHGNLSFQRIIWQDKIFQKAIQQPLLLKYIIKSKLDPFFNAIFYGIKSNRLSFLLSSVPNWYSVPDLGFEWKFSQESGLGDIPMKNEQPRKICLKSLDRVKNGFKNIESLLIEMKKKEILIDEFIQNHPEATAALKISRNAIANNISVDKHDLNLSLLCTEEDMLKNEAEKLISNSTISQLLQAFHFIIDTSEKAFQLTKGNSETANLLSLGMQTNEIMKYYDKVLQFHDNQDELCFGYGIISHALDPRHLAAALHYDSKFIKDLMDRMQVNESSQAANYIKIRLQQVIELIIEKRENLGCNLDMIIQGLSG